MQSRRAALAAFAATAVLVVHVALLLFGGGSLGGARTDCWILPNGYVVNLPGGFGCSLVTNDRVVRIEADMDASSASAGGPHAIFASVVKGEGVDRITLLERNLPISIVRAELLGAFLLSLLFLSMPIGLLVKTEEKCAVPLTLLYASFGVLMGVATSRETGMFAAGAALVSVGVIPGAIGHLGMVFPRSRRILAVAPQSVWLPYCMTLIVVAYGWLVLNGSPLLWPAFVYLVLLMTLTAWGLLALACGYAVKESASAVERGRSRLFLRFFAGIPVIATLALIPRSFGFGDWLIYFAWFAAITLPLLIIVGISEYNLFNFSWNGRRWAAQILHLTVSAAVLFAALALVSASGSDTPSVSFLALVPIAIALSICIEIGRRWIARSESWIAPEAAHLREARLQLVDSMARAQSEDAAVTELMDAVYFGVRCNAAAIFLREGSSWVLASVKGSPDFSRVGHAREAFRELGEGSYRHLVRCPVDEELPDLVRVGVEAVFALRSGDSVMGLMLLGPRGSSPYADPQLEFVSLACDRAATALRMLQLTEDHIERERQAATGRTAVVLAHDLGKELGWLGRIAQRLPERIGEERRLLRDVEMIRELSEALVPAVRGFVREAQDQVHVLDGPIALDDVIDSSVRRMNRIHAGERVSESVDPGARRVLVDRSIRRVLANLLDNALLATDETETVQLYATFEDGCVRIQVDDRGPGISAEVAERMFEPGFTTRPDDGGLGVGLTVARDMVSGLGGQLVLENREGGGARAVLRIPGEAPAAYQVAIGG